MTDLTEMLRSAHGYEYTDEAADEIDRLNAHCNRLAQQLANQSDDGKCRFNCRTEKENFVDGWMAGARHLDDSVEFTEGPLVPCWITEQLLAEEAYDERKRRQA